MSNITRLSTAGRPITIEQARQLMRRVLPGPLEHELYRWASFGPAGDIIEVNVPPRRIAQLPPKAAADARAALERIERAMSPGTDQEIRRAVLQATVLPAGRETPETVDAAFLTNELFDLFGAYPPDIVSDAVQACISRRRWRPAYADLKAELDRRYDERRAIRDALRKLAEAIEGRHLVALPAPETGGTLSDDTLAELAALKRSLTAAKPPVRQAPTSPAPASGQPGGMTAAEHRAALETLARFPRIPVPRPGARAAADAAAEG